MILKKGTVFASPYGANWCVLVHIILRDGKIYACCICDYANNIEVFEIEEATIIVPIENFDCFLKTNLPEYLKTRKIPYKVVVEVLSGEHDNRFESCL